MAVAGEALVDAPRPEPDLFTPVLILATAYALGSLLLSVLGNRLPAPGWLSSGADLAFLFALTYYSGGAESPVRYGFLIAPLIAACIVKPPLTAVWAGLCIAGYLGVALLSPSSATNQDLDFVATQGLVLTWFAITGVLLSIALTRRNDEVLGLAKERGRLVARVRDAEDRERRRLAEALHDGPLQTIVAVRQDILDTERGDLDRLSGVRKALDQTVGELRAATFDLHPHLLDYAGLGPALEAVARDQAERAGYDVVVEVAALPSKQHDDLLFSLGRELLTNACKHAQARHVSLTVTTSERHVVLEVADDGIGCDAERRTNAVRRGHIGLAAASERVAAAGGILEIDSDDIIGTRVTARVPQRREDDLGAGRTQAPAVVRGDRRETLTASELV